MFSFYGLFISLGIGCAALYGARALKDEEEDTYWGLIFWCILSGVIGARLYHVLDYFSYYSANPKQIFMTWHGGMGIYGGIIGVLLATTIYLKIKKQPILKWLDIMGAVAPLGQAIGRFGNFINKELYGLPTTLPWGIYIPKEGRKHHPLFFYEIILNIILFISLQKISKSKKFQPGTIWFLYLLGYGIIRYWLEFLRIESWHIGSLNVAQTISILLITVSVLFILKKDKK